MASAGLVSPYFDIKSRAYRDNVVKDNQSSDIILA